MPEVGDKDRILAEAIGVQIREYRNQLKMTVVEVSKQSGLSQGVEFIYLQEYCHSVCAE